MAIHLKNSWNVPPAHWGSFADIQYAVKVNYEKVYNIDPNDSVLDIPAFWGMPVIDYSGKNALSTTRAIQVPGYLYFDGDPQHIDTNKVFSFSNEVSVICRINPGEAFDTGLTNNRRVWGQLTDTGIPEFSFQIFSDDNFYVGFNSSGDDDRVILAASATNWIHHHWQTYILSCVDGGYSRLYHKGIEIGNNGGGTSFNAPSTSFRIARHGNVVGAPGYFRGSLAVFSILNTALTINQIARFEALPYALYQKVSRPFYLLPIVAPTTAAPTTTAATTVAPTTLAPATTPVPTTPIYTTIPPTTELVATTPLSTTLQPTTLAPTTLAPTTLAPTTVAPTSLAPTTIGPTTLVPTTAGPVICIKNANSFINDDMNLKSTIAKEMKIHGNLC